MESTMRNLLSRMSWNSGVARAAVVGLADVAEVVALEGVEDFGGVVIPAQARTRSGRAWAAV